VVVTSQFGLSMANEPQYRDQSKLDYLPAFNDKIVVRIGRVAVAAAVAAGLFGILYFSLAPAAMTTDVTIVSVQQDGYLCKMIASITRTVMAFSDGINRGVLPIENSNAVKTDVNAQITALVHAVSSEFGDILLKNPRPDVVTMPWLFLLYTSSIVYNIEYDNVHFNTYDECLAAVRAQTTCRMTGDAIAAYTPITGPGRPNPPTTACMSSIQCFSFNDKLVFARPETVWINRTLLADPAFGQCNNQANATGCSNINSNCESLKRFRAGYENIFRKTIMTPELLCKPFLVNPPYICTKSVPPSVPSILSQSLAFMTTALAVVKTVLALAVKVQHSLRKSKNEPDISGSEHPRISSTTNTEHGNTPMTHANCFLHSFGCLCCT
jgi:hypothetical protein